MERDFDKDNKIAEDTAAGDHIEFVKDSLSSSSSSSMVWSVVVHSGSLYVQSDTEIQFSLGPILGIQPSKDKGGCIKVSCHTEFN